MKNFTASKVALPVTVAYGDGIGPDIMHGVLDILKEAGAQISPEVIEVGEKVYEKGFMSGISDSDWKIIKKNRIFLKAPITTPQGSGYKSLNVTIRKALNLYQNVRPVRSYSPFVKSHFSNIDCVIYRENEEDLYAGIEHTYSPNTFSSTKLLTKIGSEKIIRAAFEYCVKANRKKLTCMSKDNIMKITDGMFHKVFQEIAKEYPQIQTDHMIIDIGSARIATHPNNFDVIVTLNLYGDIISDILADVAGSVGLAGSANIGDKYAMFEAIHGSAPALAGQNKANLSGLLNGAIMMLAHIGQGSVANKIENALLYTIESGVGTKDIYQEGISKKLVGTKELRDEIIKNIGKKPEHFKAANYSDFEFSNDFDEDNINLESFNKLHTKATKNLFGVDVYISGVMTTKDLASKLVALNSALQLHVVSVKGFAVYTSVRTENIAGDFWKCRFVGKGKDVVTQAEIIDLLTQINSTKLEIARTDNLYVIDGNRAFSLDQGE